MHNIYEFQGNIKQKVFFFRRYLNPRAVFLSIGFVLATIIISTKMLRHTPYMPSSKATYTVYSTPLLIHIMDPIASIEQENVSDLPSRVCIDYNWLFSDKPCFARSGLISWNEILRHVSDCI